MQNNNTNGSNSTRKRRNKKKNTKPISQRPSQKSRTSLTLKERNKLEKQLPILQQNIHLRQSELQITHHNYDQITKESILREQEFDEKKKFYENERNKILAEYGGQIPKEVEEQNAMRKSVEVAQNRNSALQANIEVIQNHLQFKLDQMNTELKKQKKITNQTTIHNNELEQKVKELQMEYASIELKLQQEIEKDDNQIHIRPSTELKSNIEYPPESTVIHNLLQAQVEFYFSNYNLKRDKRLLQNVIADQKGFLPISEVMKLSRIRQLCTNSDILLNALQHSRILSIRNDSVGRLNFEIPHEQEFPFRRTVFVYGLPFNAGVQFLEEMLQPFGKLSKIQFDHGPDTIDRQIGKRFLNRPRIYTLYLPQSYEPLLLRSKQDGMIFRTKHSNVNIEYINCDRCKKAKLVNEGFYTSVGWKFIFCVHCGSQLADEQLSVYYNERDSVQQSHSVWLGNDGDGGDKKTALVVFESQRQATRASYCRARLGWKGAFTAHFHHYSKVKKSIVLNGSRNTAGNGRGKRHKSKNKQQWKHRNVNEREGKYYHTYEHEDDGVFVDDRPRMARIQTAPVFGNVVEYKVESRKRFPSSLSSVSVGYGGDYYSRHADYRTHQRQTQHLVAGNTLLNRNQGLFKSPNFQKQNSLPADLSRGK